MDDISLLGNAAAVPLIMAVTQLVKKNFSFAMKRKSDVVSGLVAVIVCFGWDLYMVPANELRVIWGGGPIDIGKHLIDLTIISFATWLSASKSYDLFVGDRKKTAILDQHLSEKQELSKNKVELEQEVVKLRNGDGRKTEKVPENDPISDELRAILEG